MIETPVRPVGLDTVEQALAALAEVVAGREDYVYPKDEFGGCMNVDPNQPGCGRCLIGTLLLAHGVPWEVLTAEHSAQPPNFSSVSVLVADGVIELPEAVVEVLGAAQDVQDSEQSWGVALANAREYADLYGPVPA